MDFLEKSKNSKRHKKIRNFLKILANPRKFKNSPNLSGLFLKLKSELETSRGGILGFNNNKQNVKKRQKTPLLRLGG